MKVIPIIGSSGSVIRTESHYYQPQGPGTGFLAHKNENPTFKKANGHPKFIKTQIKQQPETTSLAQPIDNTA